MTNLPNVSHFAWKPEQGLLENIKLKENVLKFVLAFLYYNLAIQYFMMDKAGLPDIPVRIFRLFANSIQNLFRISNGVQNCNEFS